MAGVEEIEWVGVLATLFTESVLSLKGFAVIFVGVEGREPYWLPEGEDMYSFSTPAVVPRLEPMLRSLLREPSPSLFLARDLEFCFSASFSIFFRLSITSLVGSIKSLLILSR